MEGDNKPALVALVRRREQVIDWLSQAFAEDALGLEEYEDRVSLAHRATALEQLDKLVADLERPADAPVPTEALAVRQPAPVDVHRAEKKTFVSIMGGLERRGNWRVPKRVRMFTFMGGAELDFREVDLPPGVTDILIINIMGGTEIIVPPTLHVECDGWAIMGGFEDLDRSPARPEPDAPLLRIRGFSLMGGFEIETRLPGETKREARKRRKRETRDLRNGATTSLPEATARTRKRLPGAPEKPGS